MAPGTTPAVVEHCDKCGTELADAQARHHRYRIEDVHEDERTHTGRLCADCLVDFEEWLAAAPLSE